MRGRRPLPTHLKVIRGTARSHRLPKNEPKPEGALVHPPDWFNEEQKRAWSYAIAHSPRGMLKVIDGPALVAFIIAADEHRAASLKIEESGLVVVSQSRRAVANPFVRIRRNAALVMLKAASELGFTPASRSRIEIQPEPGGGDEWDEILNPA